jgi:histidyl-tRNA synthetase
MLQNGLLNEALPQRVYYLTSCFRHERPQAGRLREFHQFGVEMAGSASPAADAEVISLANTLLNRLGIKNIELYINSIGCPECRKAYHAALKEYFSANIDELCGTCKDRLERNPMRILDCKSPVCSKIAEDAPVVLDFICDDCREHFTSLQKYLDTMGIEYTVNPQIVRGLDYYTRTVFEFISKYEKTEGLVVCGGGRYDGLIEELGGNPLPACGFGLGLERLVLTMESAEIPFPEAPKYNLSIVTAGENAVLKAVEISSDLRSEGYSVSIDTVGRSIKAQMKYSNKIGAEYTVVLGDNELTENKAKLKNMSDGTETEITLDNFSEEFFQAVVKDSMNGIADASFSGMNFGDIKL